MKRILVVLFSLICFIGYAQTPYPTPYTQQGSPSTLVQVRGGWKADSTAMMPKYVDTITANLYKTKLYAGSIIFTTGDGNYWYRSADAARWLLFGNSVTNCLGTQLISGSITWSGSGLIFDATDLDYSIICTRYSSSATTLTLSTADPTYARIDKLYADITGNVGVITGTPAPNPQEPVINPLSQLDMGIVYIPAGSTVPAGTTQTIIYNENVEFIGTSDVPSINFAYATNPYIGSLSTYLPSAPNSSYVEWQSNGIDYLFSEAQYLKFWVRLNANFTVDPLSFLDVTFEYTDVTVSQTLAVGNGDYNMDYSLINQWQLVSIPLTGITTYGTEFNSVHFVINSAPTSFQLDYIYLLETATIPPAPVGGTWLLNGNSAINDATQYIGTRDAKKLNFGTNGQIRAYIDTAGIDLLIDDTTANVMLIDSNGKVWKTYQPTILADSPLVIYLVGNQRHIKADTTRRGAALATQYYADSVANAGGSGWSLTGNAGTDTSVNFFGTTDNRDIIIKRNNIRYGYYGVNSTGLGLYSLKYGNTGANNTSIGNYSMFNLTTGTQNTAVGFSSLSELTTGDYNVGIGQGANRTTTGTGNVGVGYASLSSLTIGSYNVAVGTAAGDRLTIGGKNTLIGDSATTINSSTDSSGAFGTEAVASTRQMAFSPYFNTMFLNLDSASGTAPAIAGIDKDGNWRKYATPSGGSSQWKDTTAGIYYADKVGIGGAINPTHTLTLGDSSIGATYFQSVTEDDDVFSIYSIADGADIVHIDNSNKEILLGELGTYKVAIGTATPDSTLTVNGGTHLMGGVRASGLATSGTYSKSLAIDASGNIYKKDTLAVSGVYAPLASPTFTGTVNGAGFTGSGAGQFFNVISTGYLRAAATSFIAFNTRSVLYSSADAKIEAKNWANTGFSSVESLYHRFGSGSPEGVVTAPIGCIYSRTDGGAGTSMYVKESGTGNTGWVAK